MSTPATTIHDAAHLKVLPDGTIISWLRIPDDRTSEAVAFVRRAVEYDDGPNGPTATGAPNVTVWISPGGWAPQTIESAGVTFPCQVVRFGEFDADQYLGAELPTLTETLAGCIHGGTWAREKALECAAQVYQGTGLSSGGTAREGLGLLIVSLARVFEVWLHSDDDRPTEPLSDRLNRAADAIEEARDRVGRTDNPALDISLDGIRRTAQWLTGLGE